MIELTNLIPDPTDPRDYMFEADLSAALPESVDLRPHCSNMEDQLTVGSCHDDKTEVLTDIGFKLFADLTGTERLATVDPQTSELSFEFPTRIVRFSYKGEMICGNHTFTDFCVTPDHKMLVRKWSERERTLENEYSLIAAKDVGWYFGLMNRVLWLGENREDTITIPGCDHKHKEQRQSQVLPLKTWLRFLGVYLAEGTMLKRDQRKGRVSYKFQIAAFKPREKDFVRETLAGLGVTALEFSDRFIFNNRRIYEFMASLGLEGVKAGEKYVPAFVFSCGADMISEFLLGHFSGDGCVNSYGVRSHYTGSSRLASDLQALIFLSGNESGVYVREARSSVMRDGRVVNGKLPAHRVSVCENKASSIDKKSAMSVVEYDGDVFCAEVPTHHTLVTRRNWKILISGNCTANATCSNAEMFLKSGNKLTDMSRLFNYFTSRTYLPVEYQQTDSGSSERMALKASRNSGIAKESIWPYDVTKVNQAPSAESYQDALLQTAGDYFRIDSMSTHIQQDIRYALASGYPVLAGLRVGEKLRTLGRDEEYVYVSSINPYWGNHELLVIGYDKDYFYLQNSWGVGWGTDGFFKTIQGVLAVDLIDLWVLQGFAGVERVGTDFTTRTNQIITLYQRLLLRGHDALGLAYWDSSSYTIKQIWMYFILSAEYSARFTGDRTATITMLYRDILRRYPDQGGLAYWVNSGESFEYIRDAFFASPEYMALL